MFSNGTTPDSAVNYESASALCGSGASDPKMNSGVNANNLTLPLNAPGCTQRISMTWVAKVTNWLAYTIDRSGMEFQSGLSCDDPLLLYRAINALVDIYVTSKHYLVTVAHDESLTGNGTVAVPLKINIQHDSTLVGLGTTASPLSVVLQPINVIHDNTLAGNGTTGSPLSVVGSASLTIVAHDTSLIGDGTSLSPLALNIQHDGSLAGTGTSSSPLRLAAKSGYGVEIGQTITQCVQSGTALASLGLVADDGTGTTGTTASGSQLTSGTVAIGTALQFPINTTTGSPYGPPGINSEYGVLTGTWRCVGFNIIPGFSQFGYNYLIHWKRTL